MSLNQISLGQKIFVSIFISTIAILLSACGDQSEEVEVSATTSGVSADVSVTDAYIRGLPPGQTVTAAFMTLNNHLEQDCKLVTVTSPIASSAEIHQHSHSDGKMSMRPMDSLVVPAGGKVSLVPGGYHLMMFGLENSLKEGEEHSINLSFENCESVSIMVPVQSVLNEKAK